MMETQTFKVSDSLASFSTDFHPSRRRWVRLSLAIPVCVRGVDESRNGFVEFTSGFNVNPGGMLLATPRSLPLEGELLLEIPFAMPNRPPQGVRYARYLQARIVDVRTSEGFQLYGLEFATPLTTPADAEHRQAQEV